jgi:hypothetical protein
MATARMVCPFSKRGCRQCGVFLGRHYYLCYEPEDRSELSLWSKGKWCVLDGPDGTPKETLSIQTQMGLMMEYLTTQSESSLSKAARAGLPEDTDHAY